MALKPLTYVTFPKYEFCTYSQNLSSVDSCLLHWCTGKSATGKSETVAVLSGRTFAGALTIIPILNLMENVKEKLKREYKNTSIFYHANIKSLFL